WRGERKTSRQLESIVPDTCLEFVERNTINSYKHTSNVVSVRRLGLIKYGLAQARIVSQTVRELVSSEIYGKRCPICSVPDVPMPPGTLRGSQVIRALLS